MGQLVVEDVSTVEPKKNFVILCRVLAGIVVDKLGKLNSRILILKDSPLDSKKSVGIRRRFLLYRGYC